MKKMSVVVIALTLAVSLVSFANAGNRNGMGGGCGNCVQDGAAVTSDQFRKFQSDTLDLRQEMMTKRFEMQRENLKGTPDAAKIAALQADITAIQAKIQDARSVSGLPDNKSDGECFQKMGRHGRMMTGGCGQGAGGCNNGPCGGQK